MPSWCAFAALGMATAYSHECHTVSCVVPTGLVLEFKLLIELMQEVSKACDSAFPQIPERVGAQARVVTASFLHSQVPVLSTSVCPNAHSLVHKLFAGVTRLQTNKLPGGGAGPWATLRPKRSSNQTLPTGWVSGQTAGRLHPSPQKWTRLKGLRAPALENPRRCSRDLDGLTQRPPRPTRIRGGGGRSVPPLIPPSGVLQAALC